MTTYNDVAKSLFDEALAWPVAGPGQSIWNGWLLRAREAVQAVNAKGRYHELLSRLVTTEREDGLSSGEWAHFMSECNRLKQA